MLCYSVMLLLINCFTSKTDFFVLTVRISNKTLDLVQNE